MEGDSAVKKLFKEADKEMIKLFESVNRSYEDFVVGMLCEIRKHPERKQKYIDFINTNPSVCSDDVVDYSAKLCGIPTWNALEERYDVWNDEKGIYEPWDGSMDYCLDYDPPNDDEDEEDE